MADMRTQIEAVTFQPVPGGYLYREPFRLPSRAQHYIVDETQKAQLVALTTPRRPVLLQVALLGTLCMMVAIACVAIWLYTGHGDPTVLDTLGIAVLTVAQILVAFLVFRWWKLRRLRPMLATLRPTELRMAPGALREAGVNAMSVKQLVMAGAASTLAATAALVSGAIQIVLRQPLGFFWLGLSVIFAVLAVVWFKRLADRAKKVQ